MKPISDAARVGRQRKRNQFARAHQAQPPRCAHTGPPLVRQSIQQLARHCGLPVSGGRVG